MAYTVRQLDAGPVIACEKMEIDDKLKVNMLLSDKAPHSFEQEKFIKKVESKRV